MKSSKSFLRSYFRKLPMGLTLLLAVITFSMLFFTFIAHEVLWEQEEAVDNRIFAFLSLHVISPGLTGFMKAVTYFASAAFLQIAYGCLMIFYLVFKNVKRAVEIAAIGLGGFLINYFMKLAFHRIRPPHPLIDPLNNFSFPSGHATSAFIFYGLLSYLLWKTGLPKTYKYIFSFLFISFSLLIGFSRVYLRVHYPSDVAAGFCIGFAWIILAIYLLEKLKKKSDVEQRTSVKVRQ